MDKRDSRQSTEKIYRQRSRHRKRQARLRRERKLISVAVLLFLLCVIGIFVMAVLIPSDGNNKVVDKKSSGQDKGTLTESGGQTQTIESSASITLQEAGIQQIKLGSSFTEPGYTAIDNDGTDLTAQVRVDMSGLNRIGEQQIIYTVQGNNGVEAKVVRQIEVLQNTEYETAGLPICMYHYVYDPASPPENIDNNFISTDALEEEMKYLHENGYYFPSWQEVRDYVDGKLLLPEKSIVLTFDDGPNYMYLGTPILEKFQTPATSFVIASYWDSRDMLYGYSSDYLTFESHSYKMHQGGGNIGHGGIYTAMSKEEVLSDLQKSFDICGNNNAFAYPFGDYTEEGCSTLEEVGLFCAVTTENAKAFPGDNPYLLPRVRMLGNQSLEEFIAAIQ